MDRKSSRKVVRQTGSQTDRTSVRQEFSWTLLPCSSCSSSKTEHRILYELDRKSGRQEIRQTESQADRKLAGQEVRPTGS